MKVLFSTSFAALLFFVSADVQPIGRGLRRKVGGQGRPEGRIQQMIATECPTFDCTGVDTENVDCSTIEKPMNKTEGSRPDFMNMTEAEKEAFKIEMSAKKEERKQKILECTCCTDDGTEKLLAGKEGTSSISGSGKPEIGGSSGRPGAGGLGGSEIDIESLLAEKCPSFDCLSVEPESVDCTRFESMTGRERRRSGFLYCGCCVKK